MELVPESMTPTDTKGPLVSKTVQAAALGLVGAVVGHFYPPLGDWMKANNEQILGVLSLLCIYGRSDADKTLNWRDWTINGVGFRF